MTNSINRELGLLKGKNQKGNPKFGKFCCSGEKTKDLRKKSN